MMIREANFVLTFCAVNVVLIVLVTVYFFYVYNYGSTQAYIPN